MDSNVITMTADYLTEFPDCQLTEAIGQYVNFGHHIHDQNCVHHIWGRRGKHEHWSNYATVSPAAHDWAHRNSVVARISLMRFKMVLGGDHFDLDVLRAASGFIIPGWVHNKLMTVELPSWCAEMGFDLLEGIEADVKH